MKKNDKLNNLVLYICDDLDIEKPQLEIPNSMDSLIISKTTSRNHR